jgi:hypothetical protein
MICCVLENICYRVNKLYLLLSGYTIFCSVYTINERDNNNNKDDDKDDGKDDECKESHAAFP